MFCGALNSPSSSSTIVVRTFKTALPSCIHGPSEIIFKPCAWQSEPIRNTIAYKNSRPIFAPSFLVGWVLRLSPFHWKLSCNSRFQFRLGDFSFSVAPALVPTLSSSSSARRCFHIFPHSVYCLPLFWFYISQSSSA